MTKKNAAQTQEAKEATKPLLGDREDKVKPSLGDINFSKNLATIQQFMVPAIILIYLGLVFGKYNIKEYNDLVTNRYFLLGFKDLQTLKDHLTTYLVDSGVWGLSYLYIRKFANPEARPKTHTFVQDGYFASLASFVTALIKQTIKNFRA